MIELPITKIEYENSVLISDFISRIKSFIDSTDKFEFYNFTPKTEGYEIKLKTEKDTYLIQLLVKGTVLSSKLEIITIYNYTQIQTYVSKSTSDNEKILEKLFSNF